MSVAMIRRPSAIFARRGEALGEGRHAVRGFQRVAGRDHQPELVQPQMRIAWRATCRCPSCAGLNEPPSRPMRSVPVADRGMETHRLSGVRGAPGRCRGRHSGRW